MYRRNLVWQFWTKPSDELLKAADEAKLAAAVKLMHQVLCDGRRLDRTDFF